MFISKRYPLATLQLFSGGGGFDLRFSAVGYLVCISIDKNTKYVLHSDSFYVLGQTNSSGSNKLLEKEITVLEAITMAGELTKYTVPNRANVIRNENGVGKTIKLDVKKIARRGDRSKDIVIKLDDVIVVPHSYF